MPTSVQAVLSGTDEADAPKVTLTQAYLPFLLGWFSVLLCVCWCCALEGENRSSGNPALRMGIKTNTKTPVSLILLCPPAGI